MSPISRNRGMKWLILPFLLGIPLVLQLEHLKQQPPHARTRLDSSPLFVNNTTKNTLLYHSHLLTTTTFVVFIGLEGTGHHLMKELLIHSPSLRRIDELGLNRTHKQLTKTLFSRNHPSFLNAHCSNEQDKDVNISAIQQNAVRLLQQMQAKTQQYNDSPLYIPLNCVNSVFASYPAGSRGCFKYPNIDVLYKTCRLAGVRCRHVLLHRNPYSILYSTTVKRQYNPSILSGIHLYTSMLYIIHSQLLLTHSDKSLACYGLLELNNDKSDDDDMWKSLQALLGWKINDAHDFEDYMKRIYQPPSTLSAEQQGKLVPSHIQVYMDSLMRVHDQVVNLCREHQHQQDQQHQEYLKGV